METPPVDPDLDPDVDSSIPSRSELGLPEFMRVSDLVGGGGATALMELDTPS